MATRNVGGHNVTSLLNGSHHTVAHPAQPNFVGTQGPAGYQGTNSKPGGGLPGGSGGKGGYSKSPKEVSPPNAMTTGNR